MIILKRFLAGGMILDSRKLINNILALGSSEALARLIAFVGTAYLARVLGPTGFGIIAFALAIVGYLSIGVSKGFEQVGAREIARYPDDALAMAANVTMVKIGLAFAGLALLGIVVFFLNKPLDVRLVVMLTGLSLFSLALDTSWVFKGLERNHVVGLALILGQILYVGTVVLVVNGSKDVFLVPVAQFLGEMGAAILLAVSIFRLGEIRKGVALDFHQGLRIIRSSGFMMLTKILRTLIFTFDVVLLGLLLGEREVGLYSASYRFCFFLLAIVTSIQVAYLPAFTRAADKGGGEVSELVGRSLEISSAFSIPMVVGGVLLAGPLLTTMYGGEYLEGKAAFQLLIGSIGLIFFYSVIHNVFLACERLKVQMWIMAIGAGVNIILNIILIPLYGLVGAASATVLAHGLILLMGFLFVWQKMGIGLFLSCVLRPLLAAAVMGTSLIALELNFNLPLSLGIGVIVYVTVLAAIGGIPQDIRSYWQTSSVGFD